MCGLRQLNVDSDEHDRMSHASRTMRDALECAESGERSGFVHQLKTARNLVKHPGFHFDVDTIRYAIDPIELPPDDVLTDDFRAGRGDLPAHLRGLCARWPATRSRAVVVVHPSREARRVLAVGARLVSATVIETSTRTGVALAVLACTGMEGLTREKFFEQVYRFPYVSAKHSGVLASLLHRARGELNRAAKISQVDDMLYLECHQPIVIGDPRCEKDPSERVLSLIAAGVDSARLLARSTNTPLRSVQQILRSLVEEEACVRRRQGRSIAYVVEDTSFHEPTDVSPTQT